MCIIFLRDKETGKRVLLQCSKGKDKCPCSEEAIEIENSSSGRPGKKKAYPSSHHGSSYKEMTEHKCSTKPSMINSEARSLEAPNQSQSQTLSICFESVGCAHVFNRFNQELDAFCTI